MINVDVGVPIPVTERKKYEKRAPKYPFLRMEVGDSFQVSLPADDPNKRYRTIQQAVYVASKALGRKHTVRKATDHVRVWRTA